MSAQRARSAVAADHRSAHPSIPGIPWWGAVLLAATFTAIGFAFDAGSGDKQLTFAFAATYFLGCVLAVLAVRQNGVFTAVIQPPLLLFVSVPTAYFLFTSGQEAGLKDLLINCAYPLIERFPLMFFTSAATLLIGVGRWYQGRAARKATPAPEADREAGTGLAASVSTKLSSLLGKHPDDGIDDIAVEEPPRRRRSADPSARRTGRTPPRSRHTRPPETEVIPPVADRARRSRSSRQAEPPTEPRRRPRSSSSSSSRRSMPPPTERRSGYERPERRRRPEDFAPREPHSSNGNGTHHPISRVRYRGANDGDDSPDYRPRRRTPRDRDVESWEYDI